MPSYVMQRFRNPGVVLPLITIATGLLVQILVIYGASFRHVITSWAAFSVAITALAMTLLVVETRKAADREERSLLVAAAGAEAMRITNAREAASLEAASHRGTGV